MNFFRSRLWALNSDSEVDAGSGFVNVQILLGPAATRSVRPRTHPHRLGEFSKKKSRGSSCGHNAIFDFLFDTQNDWSEDSSRTHASKILLVGHTHPPSGTSHPPAHDKLERLKNGAVSFDP